MNQPLKIVPDEEPEGEEDFEAQIKRVSKNAGIESFDEGMDALGRMILTRALKLKGQKYLATQIEAFKICTQYKSMLNRAPEEGDGAGLDDLRNSLLDDNDPPPEPPEEPPQKEPDDE